MVTIKTRLILRVFSQIALTFAIAGISASGLNLPLKKGGDPDNNVGVRDFENPPSRYSGTPPFTKEDFILLPLFFS